MAHPIPTHLITGFLGVGKTTAVLDLLKRKPATEKWAVLVNEYGQVSIDEAFIEGETIAEGVAVRSVAGGCFCCTTSPQLPVALHFLLQEAKPDRLLIETSGLGHPAALLDTIRKNYSDRLELKATLGIVTPIDFACPGMLDNPVFRDQIQMSDILVMNKADRATPELLIEFQSWAEGLFPPKLLIAATSQGRLDPAWLELDGDSERVPLFPDAHAANPVEELQTLGRARLGHPIRYDSPDACGWIFSPSDIFDEDKLLAFLGVNADIARLKGVFRVEDAWLAINRSGTVLGVKPTAYRRDSRVEVFGAVNWGEFEIELLKCAMKYSDLASGTA